jgi:hypothetical protein
MMELAAGGGAFEYVGPASDMHSASYRERTLGKHHGTALANLLQVACDGLRYTTAGDIDYSY